MRSVMHYIGFLLLDGGAFQWLWLILVSLSVFLVAVGEYLIVKFYYFWPFPGTLDRLFKKTTILRETFSFRLQGKRKLTCAQLIAEEGYGVEEHVAETEDGYVLALFRITKTSSTASPSTTARVAKERHAVLVMHGLMMCSDVWVVPGSQSLVYQLCDAGFDVWLGNNRGNRYSCKHRRLLPSTAQFWDFSLDELARYDIPAMVRYIQATTCQPRLSYVGFSQGTAQAFAAFATNPQLSRDISLFVALSPAVTVRGLSSPIASSIIQASPSFIFLLFGHEAILAHAPAWQRILSVEAYTQIINRCLRLLFGWSTTEIPNDAKPLLYRHIYSPSSVKSVVHWFQIICRAKGGVAQLAAFDDAAQLRSDHRSNFVPLAYGLEHTQVPCALFYGEADTLIDGPALVKMMGKRAIHVHVEPTYEHLDFIWGKNLYEVNREVVELLTQYAVASSPAECSSVETTSNIGRKRVGIMSTRRGFGEEIVFESKLVEGNSSKPSPELRAFTGEEQEALAATVFPVSAETLSSQCELPPRICGAIVGVFAQSGPEMSADEYFHMLTVLCKARNKARANHALFNIIQAFESKRSGSGSAMAIDTLSHATHELVTSFLSCNRDVPAGNSETFEATLIAEAADRSTDRKYPGFTAADRETDMLPSIDMERWAMWMDKIGEILLRYLQSRLRRCFCSPQPFLPRLDSKSHTHMLSACHMWALRGHMEGRCLNEWSLLFHSGVHGQSLNQLVACCKGQGPLLVLVRDTQGAVFGGYLTISLQKHPEFFGNAACFVFSLEPHLSVYPASGMNDNFAYCNLNTQTLENGFGMGGQARHYGWWIDESCHAGHSESTVTYKSPRLSSEHRYTIDAIECWGCDLSQADEVDEDSRDILKNEDKFLFDLVGRTGHSENVAQDREKPEE